MGSFWSFISRGGFFAFFSREGDFLGGGFEFLRGAVSRGDDLSRVLDFFPSALFFLI